MKSVSAILLGAMLSLLPSAAALNPNRQISQFAHTAWRLQDGYLSGTPAAIAQTTDGYMWIGTQNALFRFDGVRFTPWLAPAGKQLPSSTITSLAPSQDGGLWIGTSQGLAHWTREDLVNYEPRDRINSISIARDGTAWITRSRVSDGFGPLCKVLATELRCYGKPDGIAIQAAQPLATDALGNLWFAHDNAVIRWRPGSSTSYCLPAWRVAGGLSGVRGLAVARDNSVWVGTNRSGAGMGLLRLVNGGWTDFKSNMDASSLKVADLLLDRDQGLWVGTQDQGIFLFRGQKVDHFGSSSGLSGDTVTKLTQDREGNVWVATTRGVDIFSDLPVATFSQDQGLSSDNAGSVASGQDGTVWIGNSGSLDLIRDFHISSIRKASGLPGEQVTSLLVDHAGRLWIGVDNSLYIFQNGKFTEIVDSVGEPVGLVRSMVEDSDGMVWVEASRDVVHRLLQVHRGKLKAEPSDPSLQGSYALASGQNGEVVTAAKGGTIIRYRHTQPEKFFYGAFDKVEKALQPYVDDEGTVWAASRLGVLSLHDRTLLLLSTKNGLPCDQVYSLIRDLHGALWLYSQCGLVEVRKEEVIKWMRDPQSQVATHTFDVFRGAQPASATFRPQVTRSPDGRLWFTNDYIVQMINPDLLGVDLTPPPTVIEQITAQDKVFRASDSLRLPAHTRNIQIDYTALTFVAPQRVQFRVKLDGVDPDWKNAGARRSAFFTNLSPGSYRFHVRACNADGVWNEQGATFSFSISPAWYQAFWFRLLCALFGIAFLYGLYLLRIRQYETAMRIRLNERISERTRIARELHDTLLQTIQGSKLVADFALTSISDVPRTKSLLIQLSEWLGRASQEGRTALESLNAESAENLAAALQSIVDEARERCDLVFSLSMNGGVEEVMTSLVRDEIYWVAREAIRNACEHSGARQVSVYLTVDQNIELRIRDDGKGIAEKTIQEGKPGHYGLKGMRERASRIGAILNIVSSPDSGTEIGLKVSRSAAYSAPASGDLFSRPIRWFCSCVQNRPQVKN